MTIIYTEDGDRIRAELASHIVKCVNSHDELLEACKTALASMQRYGIEQAISKAEGRL